METTRKEINHRERSFQARTAMHFPVFTSHTRTVSSYDPDTCGYKGGQVSGGAGSLYHCKRADV